MLIKKAAVGKAIGGAPKFLKDIASSFSRGALRFLAEHPLAATFLVGGSLAYGTASEILDKYIDYQYNKALAINKPVWELLGQKQALENYYDIFKKVKQRQLELGLRYDLPLSLAEKIGGNVGSQVLMNLGNVFNRPIAMSNFDIIKGTFPVQQMGVANARKAYEQLVALNPSLFAASPTAALPYLQTAAISGSPYMLGDVLNVYKTKF